MADEVSAWLETLGLARYAAAFAASDIDLEVLPDLTDADLEKLGVSLGHRKKILRALAPPVPAGPDTGEAPPPDFAEAGERRQLTIVFCDLVGSTALAATMDPEDLRTLLSTYHGRCAEVVMAHGGEVAQFLGDGVMAQFGYPVAHEDDAERAVRCALAMIDAVRTIDANGDALHTRVGIATGTEVVGDAPGATRDRASIVGNTPSLAARLQNVAEVDRVVIAASTRRLLGDAFELTSLGERDIKGAGKRYGASAARATRLALPRGMRPRRRSSSGARPKRACSTIARDTHVPARARSSSWSPNPASGSLASSKSSCGRTPRTTA
jgi:class 3 adenylate cyclase